MSVRARFAVPVTVLLALGLAGCTDGQAAPEPARGQRVEVVAGDGRTPITGSLDDLHVAADGTVRLLTATDGRARLWTIKDGTVDWVALGDLPSAGQLAVAADGTPYVTSGVSLYRVGPDGALERVVGDGDRGFTEDGESALGPSGPIDGVAIGPDGRIHYSETLAGDEHLLKVIRRVEADGTLRTIAGRRGLDGGAEGLTAALRLAADPPPGTRAADLALPGGYYKALAVGEDGTVYTGGRESLLAISPDGTARAVAAGRGTAAAAAPFAAEGTAAQAGLDLTDADEADISVAAGNIAVTAADRAPAPAAFRWTGELDPAAEKIVDAVYGRAADWTSADRGPRTRLIRADGTVTTAAWWAGEAALHDGWLYLAAADRTAGVLVTRVRLP